MAGGKSGIFLASLNAKACTSWNLCISSWKIALYSDLFDKGELRAAERNTAARGKTAAEYSAVGGEPAKPGDRRQGGGDCLGCRGKSKGTSRGTALGCHRSRPLSGGKSGIFFTSFNAEACTSWNLVQQGLGAVVEALLRNRLVTLQAEQRLTTIALMILTRTRTIQTQELLPLTRTTRSRNPNLIQKINLCSGGHSATTGLSGAVGYRIQRRSFEESFIESKGTSRGTALGCHRSQGMAGGKSGIFLASLNAKACTSWNLCISSWKIALYSDLFNKGELRAAERNTAARGKTAAEYSAVGGEPAKPGDRRQGGGDCLGCRGKSKGTSRGTALGCHRSRPLSGGKSGIFFTSFNAEACTSWNLVQQGLGAVVEALLRNRLVTLQAEQRLTTIALMILTRTRTIQTQELLPLTRTTRSRNPNLIQKINLCSGGHSATTGLSGAVGYRIQRRSFEESFIESKGTSRGTALGCHRSQGMAGGKSGIFLASLNAKACTSWNLVQQGLGAVVEQSHCSCS
ncbi:hypothetical protein R3P38DRAFT_2809427 [Favolaschia claudopus]|uniref:Uncharacterized protein n=1 Tax=Favolaschia claudopus TaxID=2862362 RepID=A0AAV9ZDM1_9AGAR